MNILIADDEKLIRNVLKEYLLVENYHVFEANDGKEVLDIIRNNCIDLILLDIRYYLPGTIPIIFILVAFGYFVVLKVVARLCLLLKH